MFLLKSFGIWILFVFLAIINGGIRNEYISPKLGEYTGHVVSSIILISLIFVVTYFFIKYLKINSAKDFLFIGVFWVVLTVIFEFVFG